MLYHYHTLCLGESESTSFFCADKWLSGHRHTHIQGNLSQNINRERLCRRAASACVCCVLWFFCKYLTRYHRSHHNDTQTTRYLQDLHDPTNHIWPNDVFLLMGQSHSHEYTLIAIFLMRVPAYLNHFTVWTIRPSSLMVADVTTMPKFSIKLFAHKCLNLICHS